MKTRRDTAAFTLIEVLIVVAIVGLLAAAAIESLTARYKLGLQKTEDAFLEQIQEQVMASLDSTDFVNRNIFPYADSPASMTPTNFYSNFDGTYTSTSAADWFAKVATMRGTTFTSAAPTESSQPQLATILFNRYQRSRLLIPCPLNEANQQRFLLLSLMEDPAKLTFPAYDGTDSWFEAVWNTDWTNPANSIPSYIASQMGASALGAWNGTTGAGSLLPALRVVKITVPKYTVVISNTSTVNNCYVYYNNNLNNVTSAMASGVTTSNPILQGRVIQVYTGASPSTATFWFQKWLRKNEDITVQ